MEIKHIVKFNETDINNLLTLMDELSLNDYSADMQDYIINFKKQLRHIKKEE